MRVSRLLGTLVAVLVLGLVTPVSATAPAAPTAPATATAVTAIATIGSATPATARPNIVLVVMDDFSLELLSTMREGQRMRRAGAEFANAYVVNTLCCPSRAATLTGQPPHLNGVRTNTSGGPGGPLGGYPAFRARGNAKHTVNVSLHRSGYRTGLVGKFMNEYETGRYGARLPVVPGWDDFEAVLGGGYGGWSFRRTEKVGKRIRLRQYGLPASGASARKKDRTYATNVIADRTVRLLRRYERGDRPYFLYVAPYGPHERVAESTWRGEPRFPAAFSDRARAGRSQGNCGARRCSSLGTRDLPGFGDATGDNRPTYLTGDGRTRTAPSWRVNRKPMTAATATLNLRNRARMVQSIDRMLQRIRRTVGPDTYVLLTSDNGYHLGQHGLGGGKGTPYRSDTRVPLLVTGPGVVPGRRTVFTTNLDLAPTIEELAGARASGRRAGTSLVASLRDHEARGPAYAFAEHTHGPTRAGEPDADAGTGGRLDAIPSYVAVRSARGLLVRLDLDGSRGTRYAWELYDYRRRSWEQTNVFASERGQPWARELRSRLQAWVGCAAEECRRLTL